MGYYLLSQRRSRGNGNEGVQYFQTHVDDCSLVAHDRIFSARHSQRDLTFLLVWGRDAQQRPKFPNFQILNPRFTRDLILGEI
jgi:hypothetical protein